MDDTGARRRNHWVSHIARHAHEKPGAVPGLAAGPPAVDVPEDSPALIMYTSGTTGRPKGAVLSHQNLMCQSLTLIRVWRLFADDEVNLCASPLFHIASIGAIAPIVLIGGTTVLLPSGGFSSTATLDLLEAERVTSVFLVPAQWQLLCDDVSLASREVGEIVYRGPSVMSGYWQNPSATADAFRGGWFHSGDLVRADEEGFLYVVDRKKDMIITGGENVYCAEVENALAAHPAVAELAVIGAPHERWGETPVAVAVLAPGASLTLEELREWGTARLARYKLPTVLHVVDALPRNASGKVMKTVLRQGYR